LLVGTIATSLRFASGKAPAGTEIHGNRLTIQGLGSIYFAEIVIDRYSRRLTLLRFQLGSDNGVDGTACESSTGGQGYPPGTN
jgi:hypothetical protein